MAMQGTPELGELEALADELAVGAKSLASYCRNAGVSLANLSSDATPELDHIRRRVIHHSIKLSGMLRAPSDFVRHLAQQSQLLACVQWLCEMQVLACLPTNDPLPYSDVADILDVCEDDLRSAARMAATSGFLHEPVSGQVAHSPLSAKFLNDPAMLDAVIFLSQNATPSALKMSPTGRAPGGRLPIGVARGSTAPLADVLQQQPKLQRQAINYFRHAVTESPSGEFDVLLNLDWQKLGRATIVDVGAESTWLATTLASLFPHTRFCVQTFHSSLRSQMSEPTRPSAVPPTPTSRTANVPSMWQPGPDIGPATFVTPLLFNDRITVEGRTPGTLQHVQNAAVYLLHLPSPLPWLTSEYSNGRIQEEMKAHLAVLRANPASRLVLLVPIQADPTTTDSATETVACHRDLSLRQLSNERDREVQDVVALISDIKDGAGELLLTDQVRSPSTSLVGFEMRYQSYMQHSYKMSHLLVSDELVT